MIPHPPRRAVPFIAPLDPVDIPRRMGVRVTIAIVGLLHAAAIVAAIAVFRP